LNTVFPLLTININAKYANLVMESFKIGIAQYSPVHLNLGATLKKVEQIFQSLENDVDLIVFGETWLSGYPGWLDSCRDVGLWDHGPMKEVL